NEGHKIQSGPEYQLHQVWVICEKQDVPQQTSHRICGRDWSDLIFRPLLEKEQSSHRRGTILSQSRQLAGKWRTTASVALTVPANVGDFIGEQCHIGGRQPGNRGLAGSR